MPARLGRYEIVRPLAEGGMAELVLARTTGGMGGFERHVAIKCIKAERASEPSYVRMFLDEARLAAQLHHQHIVQVFDVGEEAGTYFFAMEYVHGEDLRHVLTRLSAHGAQLPLQHVVTIVMAAASALHHAHGMGIVHRDVSPANILVGYDGAVKVVDFGIAKARSTETDPGALKGKVAYMAPEQCLGTPLDRRSDVFALGIVLWELLTARRLFKGETDYVMMSAIVAGKVAPPSSARPDLPPELDAIVLRALATVPDERYQTADDFGRALEDFARARAMPMSTTELGTYLTGLLGRRPEPWLVPPDAPIRAPLDVDFDGAARTGPAESFDLPSDVWKRKHAPILHARAKAKSEGYRVAPTPLPGTIKIDPAWEHMKPKPPPPQSPARRVLIVAAVAVPLIAIGLLVLARCH